MRVTFDACDLRSLSRRSQELEDASVTNRAYCRTTFAAPPFRLVLLLGYPCIIFVKLATATLPQRAPP